MKNELFACDIDNTLIYSKKHPHSGWTCVEWIHGEEQAYISPHVLSRLPAVTERMRLVPVTSRSKEQYLRLRIPGAFSAALTANGADLLLEGTPDPQWRRETDALLSAWREEIARCYALLSPSDRYIRLRVVDDAYLFVYCGKDTEPAAEADRLQTLTNLQVTADGKKIYLLPPPLNKGTAVKRMLERFGFSRCIAAGDGHMDLPMLRYADRAVAPAKLAGMLPEGACICPEERIFSDFVIDVVLETQR